MIILDLQWKRSQIFLFFKMANTPHKGKTRHIAWLSSFLFKAQCFYRDEDDLAPDDKYYIRGKRKALWFLATFWKNDNSSCFWYTNSLNWKSNFVLIYYKSEDGPQFFIFLSSFDSIVHLFYIHNLAEKIFCGILFSKFLTHDYFLFFVSSSSIADSGTVWLDTYIKITVICRDIHRTLRKL